ncbi:vacuolar protein sorting-associated protein 2 [Pelomyxa schiedti]|nr:vacuolar protein sorting-associated protein 2 [Pelomyxa schiedti]
MDLIFGKKKTPKELLREQQRSITHSVRDIEKEIAALQLQEKKTVIEIKKLANQNQMGAVRIMARDLVRTRAQVTKMYEMKAQLTTVSLRLSTLKSTAAMTDAMKGAAKAMFIMNKQINLPSLQKIMVEFAKQSELMEMQQEMMGDALSDATNAEEEEEQTQEIVDKVLDEIGINLDGIDVPTDKTKVATTTAPTRTKAIAATSGGPSSTTSTTSSSTAAAPPRKTGGASASSAAPKPTPTDPDDGDGDSGDIDAALQARLDALKKRS